MRTVVYAMKRRRFVSASSRHIELWLRMYLKRRFPQIMPTMTSSERAERSSTYLTDGPWPREEKYVSKPINLRASALSCFFLSFMAVSSMVLTSSKPQSNAIPRFADAERSNEGCHPCHGPIGNFLISFAVQHSSRNDSSMRWFISTSNPLDIGRPAVFFL